MGAFGIKIIYDHNTRHVTIHATLTPETLRALPKPPPPWLPAIPMLNPRGRHSNRQRRTVAPCNATLPPMRQQLPMLCVASAGHHKDGTGAEQRFSWGTLTIEAGFGYPKPD
ncbi:hypothetical protein [Nocardia australiensis]|uniref:hypothetical protein n=1 Tax=Nocardia australiensis TaxID=2887191 RepID=UPI001D13821A|nr:hypothetical protein [Nocardia australiensis]